MCGHASGGCIHKLSCAQRLSWSSVGAKKFEMCMNKDNYCVKALC